MMKQVPLYLQILISLALAVIVGTAFSPQSAIFGIEIYSILSFVGKMFLNALQMIVVPLVLSSIVVGIAGMAQDDHFKRLSGGTLAYYLLTSLISILVGLTLVNLIQPGVMQGGGMLEGLGSLPEEISAKVAGRDTSDIAEVFLRMVPTNIFEAAAEGQLLGLIFFAILFGFFTAKVESKLSVVMLNFWQAVYEVMMKITMWVIRFAPIGVFGLVGKVVMDSGIDVFQVMLFFFLTVLAALAVHFFIVLPTILWLVGGINPWAYLRAMSPAVLMAFSTASSSSTLPLTISCIQNKVGVSKRVSSFVLPLGATVNMDGTALYECVAVIFIAQLYGLEMGFVTQFTVVWLALLTSIGVAGIPAASLVAITLILSAVGLPLEAIALILAVDRVLDMCRTSVNVYSDSCAAGVIAKRMGERFSPAA